MFFKLPIITISREVSLENLACPLVEKSDFREFSVPMNVYTYNEFGVRCVELEMQGENPSSGLRRQLRMERCI